MSLSNGHYATSVPDAIGVNVGYVLTVEIHGTLIRIAEWHPRAMEMTNINKLELRLEFMCLHKATNELIWCQVRFLSPKPRHMHQWILVHHILLYLHPLLKN